MAELGDQQITLSEFRMAYLDVLKKPDVFDSPQLREEFLDQLIASRILAQAAEKQGYSNEKLQYRIEAYKNKALREAHFEAVIRPQFSISEADIQQAYIFSQEQRKISHLFAGTEPEIDKVYALLKNGKTFDEIAPYLFADSVLANHGGDLGWVNWDELEYDLAMAAFQMPTGTFSAPIKSQFGYHILKVTDYKKKPLITRHEYEIHQQKAKTRLELMLGEKYALAYITTMLENSKIELNPPVITSVRAKLKSVFQRKPDLPPQMSEMQLTDDEVQLVETNLWDLRHETFATINGEKYSVAHFIGALNYIPYNIVHSSFRQSMNYAFRDFLLEQEARKMGLENTENVKRKHNLFKEFVLQLELRRDLVRKVTVDEAEIKTYYNQNKTRFKDANFEQVEPIIRSSILRQKRAEVVPALVTQLLKNKPVNKNVGVIHRYYESVNE